MTQALETKAKDIDLSNLGTVNTMFAASFSKLGIPIKTKVSATVLEDALKGTIKVRPLPVGTSVSGKVDKLCAHFFCLTINEQQAQAGIVVRVTSTAQSRFKLLYFEQDVNGGYGLASQNRDGFVMGEGAGVLLLEELEHAKKRGAHIYAEFLGGSFTCDAYHMTEPHPNGKGVILCIEKALAQSGVAREDVNYVNAHATSTQAGDLKEYQSLIHCFGQNPDLRVNSTKSMIGHLLGAAGAVEAVATIQAIRTGWVHPNINLENPEEAVDTNVLVGPKKERLDIKVALSNSFGFGGHNASILFAPYK